jgi:cyclic-di-GMP-binding protein
VITRPGVYAPARLLELDEQGTISRIMITKLVERTRSFERFQFSIL